MRLSYKIRRYDIEKDSRDGKGAESPLVLEGREKKTTVWQDLKHEYLPLCHLCLLKTEERRNEEW